MDPSSALSVALGRLDYDSIWHVHTHRIYMQSMSGILSRIIHQHEISSRLSPRVHQKVGLGTENETDKKNFFTVKAALGTGILRR